MVWKSVEMPWARAMRALPPVARIARPASEAKNRSTTIFAAITIKSSNSGLAHCSGMPPKLAMLNTVGSVISATLGLPITRRLIE